MDLPELQVIIKIATFMNEYQKINKITDMCSANTSILYNFIYDNYHNLKERTRVSAVICHYFKKINEKDAPHFHIHLVVRIDETKLIDPSYEIDSKSGVLYLDSIKAFQKCINKLEQMSNISNFKFPIDDIKKLVKEYLHFVKIADEINKGNELTSDTKYSNDLKDFLEQKIKYNK